MSKKSKRSKATSITEKVRMNVLMRDRTRCIFCEMGYHNDECITFQDQPVVLESRETLQSVADIIIPCMTTGMREDITR